MPAAMSVIRPLDHLFDLEMVVFRNPAVAALLRYSLRCYRERQVRTISKIPLRVNFNCHRVGGNIIWPMGHHTTPSPIFCPFLKSSLELEPTLLEQLINCSKLRTLASCSQIKTLDIDERLIHAIKKSLRAFCYIYPTLWLKTSTGVIVGKSIEKSPVDFLLSPTKSSKPSSAERPWPVLGE